MSIVITGGNGQLGRALQNLYPDAWVGDVAELDITNPESVESFDWSGIKVVLNAAAYTNVDGAENEGYEACWQVNAVGPALLAKAARDNDFTLVHVSTDYVFDGSQKLWGEDDSFSPLSVYGASKAAGDLAVSSTAPKHYIARTSWVIGDGNNFVKTMLKLTESHNELIVVNDQIGRPTFTNTLADGIKHLADSGADYGTYNLTNDGDPVSWQEFAQTIFKLKELEITVNGTTTADYFANKPEAATRPLQSTLKLDKIKGTGFSPTNWLDDLKSYLQQELTDNKEHFAES